MITLLDTNVLIDVFGSDPEFGLKSAADFLIGAHAINQGGRLLLAGSLIKIDFGRAFPLS